MDYLWSLFVLVLPDKGVILDERRRSRSRSRDIEPIRQLDLAPRQPDGTKPWFVQMPPSDIKVKEGEPLTIRCIVDGDPKPMGK